MCVCVYTYICILWFLWLLCHEAIPDWLALFVQLSQEVSELHAKMRQRDNEYSSLAKQLADLESQEASLRAASAADTQAVRKQIAELRDALTGSDERS